jgi:D-amino-acid dehydrogenase
MGGGLRHVPTVAGRAHPAALARERNDKPLAAARTERTTESEAEDAALEIGRLDDLGPDGQPRIAPRRITGIVKSVVRAFPAFRADDFAGIEPWVGLRPCTPDGLPCLGRPRRYDNLVVNTGHAMMGISLAAVSGRMAADLVEGVPPATPADRHALDLLAPDRFA